jgi:hypothetical protein
MITKYTTKLGDRLTRRISQRVMDKDGNIKNGYTLILGIVLGFIIGVSLWATKQNGLRFSWKNKTRN